MSEDLFRKQAVQAFYDTEARGGVLTVAPPRTMALFAAMAALLLGALAVLVFGRAAVYAEGRGTVRPDVPPIVLRAPIAGTIASVEKTAGARGRAGDLAVTFDVRAEMAAQADCTTRLEAMEGDKARLDQRLIALGEGQTRDAALAMVLVAEARAARDQVTKTEGECAALRRRVSASRVVLPVDAEVDGVDVSPGTQVQEGEPLVTLVAATAVLIGYVALPEAHRSDLAAGARVRLKLDSLPADDASAGEGTVRRLIDALPASVKIEGAGPLSAYAEVSLARMPSAAPRPRAGMAFTADVFVEDARLWKVLFGPS